MATKKEAVMEEVMDTPVEQAPAVPAEPEMVPMEEYKKLYEQAMELQSKFQKLATAYNVLLENYISGK